MRRRRAPARRTPPTPPPAPAERSSADPAATHCSDAFAILGRPLVSHRCTPAIRGWLERRWRYDEHQPEPHPYRIRVVERTASPGLPNAAHARAVDIQLPDQLTLRCSVRGGEWYAGDEVAGVRACFGAGASRIAVWGATDRAATAAPSPAAPTAPWPALYVAFCEALRASGLVPFHAAVVVRDGHAIALAGPSGTGKTTTLLRLLDRGWLPLAEDFSWLDPASGSLYGWDRGLRLWPDALARVPPGIAAAPWTVDRDGKRLLEWDAVPAARVPRARLSGIVLLDRDAARPSSITGLSRYAAVRVLWEATGVPLTGWVRERTARHAARLARTIRIAQLTLGTGRLPEPDALLA